MKKIVIIVIFVVIAELVFAQITQYWPTDELVIVEGLIVFADESRPVLNMGEPEVLYLDVPTNVWPGGLKEGDNVRVQGKFLQRPERLLEVSSIEVIPTPRLLEPVTNIAPTRKVPEGRQGSVLENVAVAAANSAEALQIEEVVDDNNF